MFLRNLGWLALLAPLAPVHAQPEAPAPATSVKQVYPASAFELYSPQTALDVVRQIPGFVIQQAEERRGLSENATNVLINGEPVTGKGEAAVVALSRIPFGAVVRVEVRDGATLDVPGLSGQVVNVVLAAQGASGQFTWSPEFRLRRTDAVLLDGSASVSGSSGDFEYTIGIANDSVRDGAAGPEFVSSPEGLLLDVRDETFFFDTDQPTLSGSLRYRGAESTVANINLLYRRYYADFEEASERSGPGLADRLRIVNQEQEDEVFEAGGDLQFVSAGGLLKLIGLHRWEDSFVTSAVETEFADASPPTGTRFERDTTEKQTVARAEQSWSEKRRDWQVALEASVSTLDVLADFSVLDARGNLIPLPLPGASGRIEEQRVAAEVAHARPLSESATVALSAGAEWSWLRQAGSDIPTRRFFRPRGSAAITWQVSKKLQLAAEAERRIGQIEFFDFLASLDLADDRANLRNPLLEPPESWDLEISARRSLAGFGQANLRVYARFIENLVDRIPIGEVGDAVGNIANARLYGVEWNSAFDLSHWGWNGARFDSRFQLQESELEDPVTGEERRISNNLRHLVNLSLRHDVPGTDWAWGSGFSYVDRAPNFRFSEVEVFGEGAVASLFVEHKDVAGLRVRATVLQAIGHFQSVERFLFLRRRGGDLAAVERRERSKGPIFSFSVSGRF